MVSALLALLAPLAHAGGADIPLGEDGRLTVGLTGQFRVQARVPAEGDPTAAFRFHRVRPTLQARFADDAVRATLQLNTMPGVTELLDLKFGFRVAPGWRLWVGQMKTPFTTYRDRSFRSMVLADWAVVSRALGNERQLGFKVGGDAGPLNLTLGLYTGQNRRANHGIRLPQLYGVSLVNPSDLIVGSPGVDRFSPEVFLRVARYSEGFDPKSGRSTSAEQDWATGFVLSGSVDARARPGESLAARVAGEAILQGRGVGLALMGATSAAPTDDGVVPGLHAGMVEAAFRLSPLWEVAARGAGVFTAPALVDAARAAGGDPWSLEGELGVGLNAFPVQRVIVQTDVRLVRRAFEAGPEDRLEGRLQLQVAL
jgi:hypothetical protein